MVRSGINTKYVYLDSDSIFIEFSWVDTDADFNSPAESDQDIIQCKWDSTGIELSEEEFEQYEDDILRAIK